MSPRITAYAAWLVCGAIIAAIVFSIVRELSIRGAEAAPLELGMALGEALLTICFAAVGTLILSRQSRNVIGWLLMLPAFAFALTSLLTSITSDLTTAPTSPPLWLYLALYIQNVSWAFFIFPLFLIALLFPTGKPLTPRWRWVVALAIGTAGFFLVAASLAARLGPFDESGYPWTIPNPIGFISEDTFDNVFGLPFGIALGTLTTLSVISVFLRYRRAGTIERQQLKWLLFAIGLFAAAYIPAGLTSGELEGVGGGILDVLFLFGVLAFPIAIGIAILRYRLFDIDVIIRRTLTYALVTALLLIVFFGTVILLQQLFATFTASGGNELITVLSTLAIAALFVPVRNRIQDMIDRRFNRKKYDAQQVLSRFGETVRDETDLEKLTNELVSVVQETMQPKSVTLWLKTAEDPSPNIGMRRGMTDG